MLTSKLTQIGNGVTKRGRDPEALRECVKRPNLPLDRLNRAVYLLLQWFLHLTRVRLQCVFLYIFFC